MTIEENQMKFVKRPTVNELIQALKKIQPFMSSFSAPMETQDEIDNLIDRWDLAEAELTNTGWIWPRNARKRHYFNNKVLSLCLKWPYNKEPFVISDSGNNCQICKKKKEKLEERNV